MLKKKIKRKPLKTDFSFFFFFPLPLFCFVIFSPSRQVLATNLSKFLVAFFTCLICFVFALSLFSFYRLRLKIIKIKVFGPFFLPITFSQFVVPRIMKTGLPFVTLSNTSLHHHCSQ